MIPLENYFGSIMQTKEKILGHWILTLKFYHWNRLQFSKSFLNILFIEIADKNFDSVKWIYLELQILVNTKVIEKKNLANAMELLIPFTFT